MDNPLIGTIITDVLWVAIATGWAILIVTGLEADKPLSGGIPGHVDLSHHEVVPEEGPAGRLGTMAGWALFLAVSAALPLVLWWIFAVHAG
jgi:hypothetical protein